MGTNNKPIDNMNKTELLQDRNGTPVRRFRTPWIPCNLGFFRVDLSIIRPQSEKPKSYFTLGDRQIKNARQAFSDAVEFLKKELR